MSEVNFWSGPKEAIRDWTPEEETRLDDALDAIIAMPDDLPFEMSRQPATPSNG